MIPAVPALRRRRRLGRISFDPAPHVEEVGLLAPDQSGVRLALHPSRLVAQGAVEPVIKLIGLAPARLHDGVKVLERPVVRIRAKPQPHLSRLSGRHVEHVEEAGLSSLLRRVDRSRLPLDQVAMEGVLGESRCRLPDPP